MEPSRKGRQEQGPVDRGPCTVWRDEEQTENFMGTGSTEAGQSTWWKDAAIEKKIGLLWSLSCYHRANHFSRYFPFSGLQINQVFRRWGSAQNKIQ